MRVEPNPQSSGLGSKDALMEVNESAVIHTTTNTC